MIQYIETSIGVFDMPPEDKEFMAEFVKNVIYDDYDLLVQLCDVLALPTGFCLLEKRFVDVTIRYGIHPATIDRWKAVLNIKAHFEKIMGCIFWCNQLCCNLFFDKGDSFRNCWDSACRYHHGTCRNDHYFLYGKQVG